MRTAASPHLLLTDVVLPGLNGRQIAEQSVALRPGLRVAYMSGYTNRTIVTRGMLDPGLSFIEKPIVPDQLLRKVREFLG